MDWLEQANRFNKEWLEAQKKMMNDFVQGADGTASFATTSATESAQTMAETGKKLAKQYLQMLTPVKAKTVDDYVADANKIFYENYSQAFKKTQGLWSQFGKMAVPKREDAEPEPEPEVPSPFEAFMSPDNWWKQFFSEEQFGAKMTDLAMFAGVTNYDKKLALAADEWQHLQGEIANYAYIVMSAWLEANNRFQAELEEAIKSKDGTKGWQELTEYWQRTADKALMEMHKSEEFLKAQKSLIEASTAYRMAEQTVAEETGKALHLPTRSEVDELHHKVYELSKELRLMKRELQALKNSSAAKPKTKAAPRRRATTKASKES